MALSEAVWVWVDMLDWLPFGFLLFIYLLEGRVPVHSRVGS